MTHTLREEQGRKSVSRLYFGVLIMTGGTYITFLMVERGHRNVGGVLLGERPKDVQTEDGARPQERQRGTFSIKGREDVRARGRPRPLEGQEGTL